MLLLSLGVDFESEFESQHNMYQNAVNDIKCNSDEKLIIG